MIIRRLIATILFALSTLMAWTFYDRYWRWYGCFNDQGRCYDSLSQLVYLEQAGIIWGGLCLLALVAAMTVYPRNKQKCRDR